MIESNDIPDSAERPSLLTRRGVLRLLTLSSAGLLAGTSSSHAFLDFLSSYGPASAESLKNLRIPLDWQKALGPQLPSYVEYLRKLRLKNVSIHQIIEPHTHVRGSVHNTLPPRSMWGNVRSTLRVIDSLSERLDVPVKDVVSVYRSRAYNSRCPGAKSSSYHLRNNAVDVVFSCPPGKVSAMARAMRSTGIFRGGVGRYSGFTHIDTRGSNVDW